MNPNLDILQQNNLPEYSCPDLANRGKSWVYPISKPEPSRPLPLRPSHEQTYFPRINCPYGIENTNDDMRRFHPCIHSQRTGNEPKAINVLGTGKRYVHTSRGIVTRRMLQPSSAYSHKDLLPSDSGSRIGMMLIQSQDNPEEEAELHFIFNGCDQGACTKHIPYKNQDLFAVIDVYGTTKEVRIIQVYDSECFIDNFHFFSQSIQFLIIFFTYHAFGLFIFVFVLQLARCRIFAWKPFCLL